MFYSSSLLKLWSGQMASSSFFGIFQAHKTTKLEKAWRIKKDEDHVG